MIGIPIGLFYANAGEWLIHRHVLHARGVRKGIAYALHWKRHHPRSRRGSGHDPDFTKPVWRSRSQQFEVAGLVAIGAIHLPLFPIAPFFTGSVLYSLVRYHRVHKKSHTDPEWARNHLPWHYDHHMGPNQHKNWCVSKPWFDHIMGTRVPYVGTERERRDRERSERRKRAAAP